MTTLRSDLQALAQRFQREAGRRVDRAAPSSTQRALPLSAPRTAPDLAAGKALVAQFRGEWISGLPSPWDSVEAGSIPLFEDGRVTWAVDALGGVATRAVLELGPLEGGHSFMLERAGAASVVAIEGSVRAYLRCLVVQQLYGLDRVCFVLSDFHRWLAREQVRFDVCFASGVLYHQRRPVRLLRMLADHADRLFLWTHYFCPSRAARDEAFRSMFRGSEQETDGDEQFDLMLYHYGDVAQSPTFCGGMEEWGGWLTREGLLRAVERTGWAVDQIGFDAPDGPNGPALALVATRRNR